MNRLLAAVVALSGCMVPRDAWNPRPVPPQVQADRAVHARTLPVPIERVFPRVIEVLLDAGYVVRSVDAPLGFVSFYNQWETTYDPIIGPTVVTQEGTLLFSSEGPATTRVRLSIITRSGRDLKLFPDPEEQAQIDRALLELIEKGLTAPARRTVRAMPLEPRSLPNGTAPPRPAA
jgi:hypothetical protein